jgi:hypothetical protein
VKLPPLLGEVLIAAVIAIVVLAVVSGPALAGIIALVVLVLCGLSLLVDRRSGRRSATRRRFR